MEELVALTTALLDAEGREADAEAKLEAATAASRLACEDTRAAIDALERVVVRLVGYGSIDVRVRGRVLRLTGHEGLCVDDVTDQTAGA